VFATIDWLSACILEFVVAVVAERERVDASDETLATR
jgi:hypothetical protein